MGFDLIKSELKLLLNKNIIVFFKYATVSYNIRKSGKLLAVDDKFFVVEEVKDGRSTYSYDFVVQVMEDRN